MWCADDGVPLSSFIPLIRAAISFIACRMAKLAPKHARQLTEADVISTGGAGPSIVMCIIGAPQPAGCRRIVLAVLLFGGPHHYGNFVQ